MCTLLESRSRLRRLGPAGFLAFMLATPVVALQAPQPPPEETPEINVGLAGGAVALVVGGVLVLTTRRRRKLARS